MTLPKGSRSVSALAWSTDGRYIAAADMSDDHNIHVFDTQTLDKKNKATKSKKGKETRKKANDKKADAKSGTSKNADKKSTEKNGKKKKIIEKQRLQPIAGDKREV
mgnify:CR=1 FL=1